MFIFAYLAIWLVTSSFIVLTTDGSLDHLMNAYSQASMGAGNFYGYATLTISSTYFATLTTIKSTTQPIIVNTLQSILAAVSPYTTTPIQFETVITTEQLVVKDWTLLLICGVGAVVACFIISIGFTVNYALVAKSLKKDLELFLATEEEKFVAAPKFVEIIHVVVNQENSSVREKIVEEDKQSYFQSQHLTSSPISTSTSTDDEQLNHTQINVENNTCTEDSTQTTATFTSQTLQSTFPFDAANFNNATQCDEPQVQLIYDSSTMDTEEEIIDAPVEEIKRIENFTPVLVEIEVEVEAQPQVSNQFIETYTPFVDYCSIPVVSTVPEPIVNISSIVDSTSTFTVDFEMHEDTFALSETVAPLLETVATSTTSITVTPIINIPSNATTSSSTPIVDFNMNEALDASPVVLQVGPSPNPLTYPAPVFIVEEVVDELMPAVERSELFEDISVEEIVEVELSAILPTVEVEEILVVSHVESDPTSSTLYDSSLLEIESIESSPTIETPSIVQPVFDLAYSRQQQEVLLQSQYHQQQQLIQQQQQLQYERELVARHEQEFQQQQQQQQQLLVVQQQQQQQQPIDSDLLVQQQVVQVQQVSFQQSILPAPNTEVSSYNQLSRATTISPSKSKVSTSKNDSTSIKRISKSTAIQPYPVIRITDNRKRKCRKNKKSTARNCSLEQEIQEAIRLESARVSQLSFNQDSSKDVVLFSESIPFEEAVVEEIVELEVVEAVVESTLIAILPVFDFTFTSILFVSPQPITPPTLPQPIIVSSTIVSITTITRLDKRIFEEEFAEEDKESEWVGEENEMGLVEMRIVEQVPETNFVLCEFGKRRRIF